MLHHSQRKSQVHDAQVVCHQVLWNIHYSFAVHTHTNLIIAVLVLLSFIFISPSHASSSSMEYPIVWNEYTLPSKHSFGCTMKDNSGQLYVCGGKSASNKFDKRCQKFTLNGKGKGLTKSETISTDIRIKFYDTSFSIAGLVCEIQNEGAFYDDTHFCILDSTIGSKGPQCVCCEISATDNAHNGKMECEDIKRSQECASVHDSCVAFDPTSKQLIQVGGYANYAVSDEILCFNVETQKYEDKKCGYGSLAISVYNPGCTIMQGYDSSLLVVGGLHVLDKDMNTQYQDEIQYCSYADNKGKGKGLDCEILGFRLPIGLIETRVVAISDCLIVVIGGREKINGLPTIANYVGIGDICAEEWVHESTFPVRLTDFALLATDDALCVYGGLSLNDQTSIAGISQKVYCAALEAESGPTPRPTSPTPKPTRRPTPRPTPKPTTRKPTRSPTPKPTKPTKTPTDFPTEVLMEQAVDVEITPWKKFSKSEKGWSGQTCATVGRSFLTCGGYSDSSGGGGGDDDAELLHCNIFDEYGGGNEEIAIFEFRSYSQFAMPNFYCDTQCSVIFDQMMFVVAPVMMKPDARTTMHFYLCDITLVASKGKAAQKSNFDKSKSQTLCIDLCAVDNPYVPDCQQLLTTHSCVTHKDQYLYISGGVHLDGTPSDGVLVFDMMAIQWISVPQSFYASLRYPSWFGDLQFPTQLHSCGFVNNKLYMIGGKDGNDNILPYIQYCEQNVRTYAESVIPLVQCALSEQELQIPRFNHRSVTIGDSIVIACGAKTETQYTSYVEVFDTYASAFSGDVSSDSYYLQNSIKSCCLTRMPAEQLIIVSGGERITSNERMYPVSLISKSTYYTATSTMSEALRNCRVLDVQTSDEFFSGQYIYYDGIETERYLIFGNTDNQWAIFDLFGIHSHYLANYAGDIRSCSFSGAPPLMLGIGTWIVTRFQTQSPYDINIILSCAESLQPKKIHNGNDNDNDNHKIGSFTEKAFITLVVAIAVVIIVVAIVVFLCWWKRTNITLSKLKMKAFRTARKEAKQKTKTRSVSTMYDSVSPRNRNITVSGTGTGTLRSKTDAEIDEELGLSPVSIETETIENNGTETDGEESDSAVCPFDTKISYRNRKRDTKMLDDVQTNVQRKAEHAQLVSESQTPITVRISHARRYSHSNSIAPMYMNSTSAAISSTPRNTHETSPPPPPRPPSAQAPLSSPSPMPRSRSSSVGSNSNSNSDSVAGILGAFGTRTPLNLSRPPPPPPPRATMLADAGADDNYYHEDEGDGECDSDGNHNHNHINRGRKHNQNARYMKSSLAETDSDDSDDEHIVKVCHFTNIVENSASL